MNDSKHVRAHDGTKLVILVDSVRPAVEVGDDKAGVAGVGEAWTRTVLNVAHSNSSLCALEGAMLEYINDIYLSVDDDMARGQFNSPWSPKICSDLDDRTWATRPHVGGPCSSFQRRQRRRGCGNLGGHRPCYCNARNQSSTASRLLTRKGRAETFPTRGMGGVSVGGNRVT